jgi:hypothetical protein
MQTHKQIDVLYFASLAEQAGKDEERQNAIADTRIFKHNAVGFIIAGSTPTIPMTAK